VELRLRNYPVTALRGGRPTRLEGTTLVVDQDELGDRLAGDPAFRAVSVELAQPGESVRIIHALDVVEPRAKPGGDGPVFPGFLGLPRTGGHGVTHRLAGAAVVATSPLAWDEDGISVKEAIIDMSGPGAAYCPFARTSNVVLTFELTPGLDFRVYDHAIRLATLRTAEALAAVTAELVPRDEAVLRLGAAPAGLPRIAYVDTLMTEGAVHNTFLYGEVVSGFPALLHPNELADGAIVCGNHHIACERNPTYFQQSNPVVQALSRRHGVSVDFRGVIAVKTQHVSYAEKERAASATAALARLLGLDGVVVTHDTAGHAMLNLMLICQRCEEAGVRTVLVLNELCGEDGADWGLVHVVPQADAMVSTGNKDEVVELPAVERLIGGGRLIDWQGYDDRVAGSAAEAFPTSLRRIYGAATQVGAATLTARAC
jgi:sarcosine reductase